MPVAHCIVTVWIRLTPDAATLCDRLAAAVGEPPFESTDMAGVRDMKWKAGDQQNAMASTERLKPFIDDPALVLLRVTTLYENGAVEGVTLKDEIDRLVDDQQDP